MGFFQDLKEDLSQAVNELVDETEVEGIEEVAVETEELAVETEEAIADENEVPVEVYEVIAPALMEESKQIEETLDFDSEELERMLAVEAAKTTEEIIYKGESNKMKEVNDVKRQQLSDETSVITEGMTIRGDISSDGSVDVIGTVEGNIDILGKLNITGVVRGDSEASEIYADSARITGEIVSKGSVKIGPSSVVLGNINAKSAVIAGAVKGDIDVDGPVILDTSAIVMGNIRSKSVQINNGAVIEGLCSQCYADVSPTNFFDGLK